MKLSLIAAAIAAPSASAFAPSAFGASSSSRTALQNARVDSSEAIKEALRISKEFGPSSKEAALAWETVEEMDSSDNSAATKGSLDTECATDEIEACKEYAKRLDGLAELLEQYQPKFESMRSLLASELEEIKVLNVEPTAGKDSPQLRKALADAKAISEEKGATSPEAAVAWDIVEEIAAAGTGASTGVSLEDECLVETAMEACKALDELDRVMETRKNAAG